MWEQLFQFEHPIIFKWWNISILFWIQPTKKCFPCMNYKLLHTSFFTYDGNEVYDVFPGVLIVHSESALYRDGNVDILDHFLAYSGD